MGIAEPQAPSITDPSVAEQIALALEDINADTERVWEAAQRERKGKVTVNLSITLRPAGLGRSYTVTAQVAERHKTEERTVTVDANAKLGI